MQRGRPGGVAALGGSVPAVLRPPATVSVAAAASTLVLMDMAVPFVNDGRALRTALWCWSVDERGSDQDKNGRSRDPLCAGMGPREVSAPGLALPRGVRLDRGCLRAGVVRRGVLVAGQGPD